MPIILSKDEAEDTLLGLDISKSGELRAQKKKGMDSWVPKTPEELRKKSHPGEAVRICDVEVSGEALFQS